MKNKIVSFLTLGCFGAVFAAFDATALDLSSSANSAWKSIADTLWGPVSGASVKCNDFNLPDTACVGQTTCTSTGNAGLGFSNQSRVQPAVLLLLATDLESNGAKFCAVQVNATRNSLVDWPWVRTYWPAGNKKVCFWACKDGYGGEGCKEKNAPSVSGNTLTEIKASLDGLQIAYDSTNIMRLSNVYEEADVVYEPFGEKYCKGKTLFDTKHYLFYGVLGFTSDGHGVITQPMTAYTALTQVATTRTAINVYAYGTKRTLCESGYIPVGESCERNAAAAGTVEDADSCSGWETYPSTGSYKRYYVSSKDCYEYRCMDASEGFRSSADRTCVSCSSNSKGVDSNGVCITCSSSMVFDKIGKKCREPVEYTKQDLLYGRNKTVGSADLVDQCWTKTIPSEYEQCVLDKTISAIAVKTDFTVNTVGTVGTVNSGLGTIVSVGGSSSSTGGSSGGSTGGSSGGSSTGGGSTINQPDTNTVGNIGNTDSSSDGNTGISTGGSGLNNYQDSLNNNYTANY